jgi:hypothetical protein
MISTYGAVGPSLVVLQNIFPRSTSPSKENSNLLKFSINYTEIIELFIYYASDIEVDQRKYFLKTKSAEVMEFIFY